MTFAALKYLWNFTLWSRMTGRGGESIPGKSWENLLSVGIMYHRSYYPSHTLS